MKKTNQKTETSQYPKTQPHQEEHGHAYYDNLARISAMLFAGLLALLTFLLVVGVQNQIKGFSGPLYATFGILGASLILYAISHMTKDAHSYLSKKSGEKKQALARILQKSTIAARALQQLVFIASIAVAVWFVVTYSQLILDPKPAQQPLTSQQSAPPSGGSAPAAGETAEQHAEEMKQTQQ